jgi:hypothetical protein
MDINQAALFFSGSILTVLSVIVLSIGILIVNNLFHRFWKPVAFLRFQDYPPMMMPDYDAVDQFNKKASKDIKETKQK